MTAPPRTVALSDLIDDINTALTTLNQNPYAPIGEIQESEEVGHDFETVGTMYSMAQASEIISEMEGWLGFAELEGATHQILDDGKAILDIAQQAIHVITTATTVPLPDTQAAIKRQAWVDVADTLHASISGRLLNDVYPLVTANKQALETELGSWEDNINEFEHGVSETQLVEAALELEPIHDKLLRFQEDVDASVHLYHHMTTQSVASGELRELCETSSDQEIIHVLVLRESFNSDEEFASRLEEIVEHDGLIISRWIEQQRFINETVNALIVERQRLCLADEQ